MTPTIIRITDRFIPLAAVVLGGWPPDGGVEGGITTLLSPPGGGGGVEPGANDGAAAISAGGCSPPMRCDKSVGAVSVGPVGDGGVAGAGWIAGSIIPEIGGVVSEELTGGQVGAGVAGISAG